MGQVDVGVLMGVLAFRGLTGEKRPVFEEIVFKGCPKTMESGGRRESVRKTGNAEIQGSFTSLRMTS
jgi:hypothetical protein